MTTSQQELKDLLQHNKGIAAQLTTSFNYHMDAIFRDAQVITQSLKPEQQDLVLDCLTEALEECLSLRFHGGNTPEDFIKGLVD